MATGKTRFIPVGGGEFEVNHANTKIVVIGESAGNPDPRVLDPFWNELDVYDLTGRELDFVGIPELRGRLYWGPEDRSIYVVNGFQTD